MIKNFGNLLDSLSFWLIISLIIWVPMPLGSNRPWAIGLLAIMVAVLLMLAWLSYLMLGRSFKILHYAWPAIILLIGYAVLITVQMLNGYQANFSAIQTLDPYATKIQLILTLSLLGLFISVLLTCHSTFRLKGVILGIVISGTLQALFAIYMLSIHSHYQLFFFNIDHSTNAKGTFGYHNSFAGYMELCLAAGLGLLIASFTDAGSKVITWKTKLAAALGFLISKKMQLRLFLVVMVIALVLTRSRMGNVGFMAALILSLIAALIIMKDLRKTLTIIVVSVLLIDALIIGQWVGLNKVIERIENTAITVSAEGKSESVEQRTEPAFGAIFMLKDRLWTGFGAGTFYTAFVPYKPANLTGYYDHAHNDYIEILVNTGLIGLLLLLTFSLSTLYQAIALMKSRRNFYRGVGFGSMLAILAMAIHGTVDFNLHIPANQLTLIVLCAICWAVKFSLNNTKTNTKINLKPISSQSKTNLKKS